MKRKKKPVPIAETGGSSTLARDKCLADYPQFAEAQRLAVERGRRIGRVEALVLAMEYVAEDGDIHALVRSEDAHYLLPILRAEIERLRGQP